MSGSVSMYPNFRGGAGVFDAICDYPKTYKGDKDLLVKVPVYTMDWMMKAGQQFSPPAMAAHQALKDAKNSVIAGAEILEAAKKFKDHTVEVVAGTGQPGRADTVTVSGVGRFCEVVFGTAEASHRTRADAAADSISDVISVINPVKDMTEFLKGKGLVQVSPETQAGLNLAGNVSLVLGPGRAAVKSGYDIHQQYGRISGGTLSQHQTVAAEAKAIKSWLDLAKNISYVALGVIGLVGLALGIVFQAWVPLALVTSALVFSLASYFHGHISVLHQT